MQVIIQYDNDVNDGGGGGVGGTASVKQYDVSHTPVSPL
jgi:hypothetical protein